jgi:hypothetical protein
MRVGHADSASATTVASVRHHRHVSDCLWCVPSASHRRSVAVKCKPSQRSSELIRSSPKRSRNAATTRYNHPSRVFGRRPSFEVQIGGRKPPTVDSHGGHLLTRTQLRFDLGRGPPESRPASHTGFSASAAQQYEIIDSPAIVATDGGQDGGQSWILAMVRSPAWHPKQQPR